MKTRGAETGARMNPTHRDWLWAWRELASDTDGLTPGDRRLGPVLAALAVCDGYFMRGDWAGFQQATKAVDTAMKGKT